MRFFASFLLLLLGCRGGGQFQLLHDNSGDQPLAVTITYPTLPCPTCRPPVAACAAPGVLLPPRSSCPPPCARGAATLHVD